MNSFYWPLVVKSVILISCLLPLPARAQKMSFTKYDAPANTILDSATAGPDGAIWFTANYFGINGQVLRLTTTGNWTVYDIPVSGCEPLVYGCPSLSGITVGLDGALWVSAGYANKIVRVTTSGGWSDYLIPSSNFNGKWIDGPEAITLGPAGDGACWFTERTAKKIGRIDTSGRISESSPYPIVSRPDQIISGPHNALYYLLPDINKIGKVYQLGSIAYHSQYDIPYTAGIPPKPSSLAVGSDGAIWLTEANGNRIGRFDASTLQYTSFPVPSGNATPYSIVAGSDGALWFAEQGNKIGRITTAGVITEYDAPRSVSSGWTLSNIFKGPDGAIWFVMRLLSTSGVNAEVYRMSSGPGTGRIGFFRAGLWVVDGNGDSVWNGPPADRFGYLGQAGDIPITGDWNGDGKDEIGLFRPAEGLWILDYNGDGAWNGPPTDRLGWLGQNGDIPIVGDWNGDGKDEIGFFRPSTGLWILDFNGDIGWNGPSTDRLGMLGQNGDVPVVGDWSGDGKKKIGIFRPSTGMWILDFNGDAGWSGPSIDRLGWLGQNGDLPVVGDWTGDGKAKIGFFRPADGLWILDLNGDAGWSGPSVDRVGWLGTTGDKPVVGDWTGDGKKKIGLFRPSTGMWILDLNGDVGWNGPSVDRLGWLGQNGDTPLVGRW